ncbi:hypothetical protein [Aureimonas phyllosphaerae]|uniref:Uncharacterized protein n=1 Tax=Aureimonas phyllosphaerae TaxID=1166078 RepID=A0A7W6FV45_9HYPH|nr:hypothetical protein [Aureimonas phyllosphaerae]MBB3936783.1 hypothetical protein [Aureimonas phyllosphaerae]MBB3961102.1 hypothetical protein [Aureimonas phyllosphaerae]SFF25790.1 hypothetical protein SAMN05216566_10612 [Aureimonas phyllosphaerae]
MKPDLLHALFHDLQAYGSVRLKKSKLLWMLGRVLETPTVWDMLMREWAEFGQTKPLYGFQHGDEITLAVQASEDIGARWTTRREPAQRPVPLLQHLEPAAA